MTPSFRNSAAVLSFFQWIVIINGLAFTLDDAPAVNNHMWKVTGDLTYFASGSKLLGPASAFLPDDFDYKSMIHTQGIWGLSPKNNFLCDSNSDKWMWSSEEDDNVSENDVVGNSTTNDRFTRSVGTTTTISHSTTTETPTTTVGPACDISASGRFLFSTLAQTLASVTVRYNFGGNATLRVSGNSRHPTQTNANYNKMDGWGFLKLPVDGNRMLLEAIVNKTGDYVLIDSITVESLEAPTRSTTHRPRHITTTISPDGTTTTDSAKTSSTTKRPSAKTESTTTLAPDASSTTESPSTSPASPPEPEPASGQSAMVPGAQLCYIWGVTIILLKSLID